MKLQEIAKTLDLLLQPSLAEKGDRVGLLVGDPEYPVKRIAMALDANEQMIRRAAREKIDLLITHHPLFIRPLEHLVQNAKAMCCIHLLIRHRIALYCAHTNLDILEWGTARQLCDRLDAEYDGPLFPIQAEDEFKIITFVPESHTDRVRDAMANEGAGRIGNYSHCAFASRGTGSFLALKGADPFIGNVGKLETCPEERLEMVVSAARRHRVIRALKKMHPYEEPAIDIIHLEKQNDCRGLGAHARPKSSMTANQWVKTLKKRLYVKNVRVYHWNGNKKVKHLALLPGSGSRYISMLPPRTDLYVSGDLKYHDIAAAAENMILVDAGHDATEAPVLPALKFQIEKNLKINARVYTAPIITHYCE